MKKREMLAWLIAGLCFGYAFLPRAPEVDPEETYGRVIKQWKAAHDEEEELRLKAEAAARANYLAMKRAEEDLWRHMYGPNWRRVLRHAGKTQ